MSKLTNLLLIETDDARIKRHLIASSAFINHLEVNNICGDGINKLVTYIISKLSFTVTIEPWSSGHGPYIQYEPVLYNNQLYLSLIDNNITSPAVNPSNWLFLGINTGNFIQNQNTSAQAADLWISGRGRINTAPISGNDIVRLDDLSSYIKITDVGNGLIYNTSGGDHTLKLGGGLNSLTDIATILNGTDVTFGISIFNSTLGPTGGGNGFAINKDYVQISAVDNITPKQSVSTVTAGEIHLLSQTTSGNIELYINDSFTISDTVNSRGAIYAGDYEGNFIARSLVTKQYVTTSTILNQTTLQSSANFNISGIGQSHSGFVVGNYTSGGNFSAFDDSSFAINHGATNGGGLFFSVNQINFQAPSVNQWGIYYNSLNANFTTISGDTILDGIARVTHTPVDPTDVVRLMDLSTSVSGYLPLTGGTLTGDVQQTIAPVNSNSLITKGYTDTNYVSLSGSYTNPSWVVSLPWSKVTTTPTTVSGYNITDVYTKTISDGKYIDFTSTQSASGVKTFNSETYFDRGIMLRHNATIATAGYGQFTYDNNTDSFYFYPQSGVGKNLFILVPSANSVILTVPPNTGTLALTTDITSAISNRVAYSEYNFFTDIPTTPYPKGIIRVFHDNSSGGDGGASWYISDGIILSYQVTVDK